MSCTPPFFIPDTDTFGYFQSRNQQLGTHLFELFWASRFREAFDFFCRSIEATQATRWWSIADLTMAYCAGSIVGADVRSLLPLFPGPLAPWQVPVISRYEQLREIELAGEGDSVISQPKLANKAILAAGLGLARGSRLFVETGTFCGLSCYLLSRCFANLVTIEAQPQLHAAAASLYAANGVTNVRCLLGNSADHLSALELPCEPQQVTFFLDAHYSTGPTSHDFGICPLLAELKTLFARFDRALIVIDDIRTMTGVNGYPTPTEILAVIPAHYAATVAFDQMVLVPHERPGHESSSLSHRS